MVVRVIRKIKHKVSRLSREFAYAVKFAHKSTPQDSALVIHRVSTLEQYNATALHSPEELEIQRVCAAYSNNGLSEFTVPGYSYPARKWVDLHVDHLYSDGVNINWRERLVCPITQLNNRLRACIHLIDKQLGIKTTDSVYIAEQLTPLYSYLSQRLAHVTGSEYLGPNAVPGSVNERNLRHEDATRLSFVDASFNYYLSFECLEHIPDYKAAFSEAHRILKKGGKFFFTVPFRSDSYANEIRATIDSRGNIQHHMEPEYHGDPVHSDKGILCFQNFGWQMMDELKQAGFSDAFALVYQSLDFGYYTSQKVFIAVK